MIKISTFFQNRITAPNLIFKDTQNKGVNIIYLPELGNSGIDFINLYRKKGYWDYVVIPMTFSFLSHKVYTTNYYKSFKKNIPTIRIQRKFIKVNQETKSIVVDLTALSENFAAFSKSRSKRQTVQALISLIESFAIDNKVTQKEIYFLIDGNSTDEKEVIDSLYYIARLNANKIRIKGIEGIVLYGNKRFWPLTIKEKDKDGDYLKININILTRYMKEVHAEEVQAELETPEQSIENTQKQVRALYDVHKKTLNSLKDITGTAKKSEEIEENPLELIKNEVERNKHLKGKTFEEKLSNLFRHKPKGIEKNQKAVEKEDKKTKELIQEVQTELQKLNKEYNGVIEVKSDVIKRNTKQFYDPINVIGFDDFHSYDKQRNEFGKNLDQAIFDLIKSLEKDPEVNIKVVSVKTVITDTNRDRLKTYKVKLKQDFGHTKPYTISFHVPIPSKGKYLKLGGNDYIMINQFFSKPVIKVSPKMVRVYTQFSTATVHLKHHSLNEEQDIKEMIETFSNSLKRNKKLKKNPEVLEKEKVQSIIEKYQLPEFINEGLFVNLEIKD